MSKIAKSQGAKCQLLVTWQKLLRAIARQFPVAVPSADPVSAHFIVTLLIKGTRHLLCEQNESNNGGSLSTHCRRSVKRGLAFFLTLHWDRQVDSLLPVCLDTEREVLARHTDGRVRI